MNEIFATLKLPYCQGCNHRNTVQNIKESNAYTLSESFSKPYLHSIEGARWNVVKLTNNLIDSLCRNAAFQIYFPLLKTEPLNI